MPELTPDSFVGSARDLAATALDAHIDGRFGRVVVDAATALEHLAKACLASRSPALLTELRNESSFPSLLALLGLTSSGPALLRTVGLRDALARVRKLVPSPASIADLETLIEMRNGTVHAARVDEVEERLMVAFVMHCDALLADLGVARTDFWGKQLAVVDAVLADASDKVAHRVEVKLVAAQARLQARAIEEHPELLALARKLADTRQEFAWDTAPELCPVCSSFGVAGGVREAMYDYEGDDVASWPVRERYVFKAERFACSVCGLQLDSAAELSQAGVDPVSEETAS